MSHLTKYYLLPYSSIPTLIVSLPWVSFNSINKIPQNSQSDTDAGPTLYLLSIWTRPPHM